MKKIFICLLIVLVFLSGCSNNKVSKNKEYDAYSDVLVIGAGGAGMSASIEASANGASVILLEKMPFLGGNTLRSEGGLNAAETSSQKALNIKDSVELMIEDTLKGGKNINDKKLVEFFARKSKDAVEWLKEMGADLSGVVQGAGASAKRMHRSADGSKIGSTIVPVLKKQLDKNSSKIKYYTQIKAVEILKDKDGNIDGVKAVDANSKTFVFKTNAVVIATGGFGANPDKIVSYNPNLKGFKTTNHQGSTGDGLDLAKELGAAFVDMDKIQTNPTVEVSSQTVISESVRGNGAIMVNQEGKRFTNEMLTRDVLSSEILKQTDKVAYLIYDDKVQESMKVLKENFELGIIKKAQTLDELAKDSNLNIENFKSSIENWNKAVLNKNDSEFKRDKGMESPIDKAPYYLIKVSPAVHYTMGGIKINTNNEVLKEDGTPIKGLYAAGEVTGGLHGANRLGGNAVADIIVFGRNAGLQAANFAKQKGFKQLEVLKEEENNSSKKEGNYKDGKFKTSAKGRNGDIELEVEIVDGSIKNITILNSKETETIFNPAKDILIKEIINKQSLEVDDVSGATISSKAFKEAISKVLEKK